MSLRDDAQTARRAAWYDVVSRPPVNGSRLQKLALNLRKPTRSHPHIEVIERATALTITVSWSDSLACRYGEQIWIRRQAVTMGECVLTGRAIRPGDEIYQPRATRPAPLNRDAMMLAACADAALQPFAERSKPAAGQRRNCRRWEGPDRLRIAQERQRACRQDAE